MTKQPIMRMEFSASTRSFHEDMKQAAEQLRQFSENMIRDHADSETIPNQQGNPMNKNQSATLADTHWSIANDADELRQIANLVDSLNRDTRSVEGFGCLVEAKGSIEIHSDERLLGVIAPIDPGVSGTWAYIPITEIEKQDLPESQVEKMAADLWTDDNGVEA